MKLRLKGALRQMSVEKAVNWNGGQCYWGVPTVVTRQFIRLPVTRPTFCHREGSRFFVACFLHSSTQMCLYQTPGRRPPPITGRFVNTVTRGWVGAPNGRAPFRFHGAVVGFVARCLSRTRNLAASNKHLAEVFIRPILAQDRPRNYFFRGF